MIGDFFVVVVLFFDCIFIKTATNWNNCPISEMESPDKK